MTVFLHCAHACGRATVVGKGRVGELFQCVIEKKQSVRGRQGSHPQAALFRKTEGFNNLSRKKGREYPVVVTVEAIVYRTQPKSTVAVFRHAGVGCLGSVLYLLHTAVYISVQGIVGACPQHVGRVFQQTVHVVGAISRKLVVDYLPSVKTVQSLGGSYPDDVPVVLQEGAHGIGG